MKKSNIAAISSLMAIALIAATPKILHACGINAHPIGKKNWDTFKKSYANKKKNQRSLANTNALNELPYENGQGNQLAWGGTNPLKWRAEAIMANAASKALNDAWSLPDLKDASVAIPTHFLDSGFHPYGDGQSNSGVDFNSFWGQPHPQLVATLLQFKTSLPKVLFRFDKTIQRTSGAPQPTQMEIYYQKNGQNFRLKIPLNKDSAGDFVGEWTNISPELNWTDSFHNNAVIVRPQPSYNDWFPIFFRHPVRTADALIKAAPPGKTQFTGAMGSLSLIDSNGHYQDPLQISKLSTQSGKNPFDTLINFNFPKGYNQTPYTPKNIHGELGSGGMVTGVGQGWTWVAEDKQARPFKIMYTCFEKRNPIDEAHARDGGVASGGGWHSINNRTPGVDPEVPASGAAEIIMNSLEKKALVVSGGYVGVLPRTGLNLPNNSESISYGLTDVAVFRWLKPGEGFITTAGINQPNHHWYFFPDNENVCTEEWVGQCGSDFSCQ